MCPLVPTDQLVRKCQSRHQPPFLQPEYCREGSREEDALDTGEAYQTCPEWLDDRDQRCRRVEMGTYEFRCDVLHRPIRFFLNARDCSPSTSLSETSWRLTVLDPFEQEVLLIRISHVCLYQ